MLMETEDEKNIHLKFKSLIIGTIVLFETIILLLLAMFDFTMIVTSMVVQYRVDLMGNQTMVECNCSTILLPDERSVIPRDNFHTVHPGSK